MLKDIKRLLGREGVKRAKKEIDAITKFESRIKFDVKKLEGKFKTIAKYLEQKERLEHERETLIKLLSMSAELQHELRDNHKRCAVLLQHAKVRWPGRDSVKFELAKCKAEEDRTKLLLGHIEQAISRMHPIHELAQKLIDLETDMRNKGGDRFLIAVEHALKKPTIQKRDLLEISKILR